MVKHATNHADAPSPRDGATSDPATESLEQRVHRLEDAVAALQDTGPLEDRLVERVSDRLGIKPPAPPPERTERTERPERTEYMITAERRTAPPEEPRAPLEPQPSPPPSPLPALIPASLARYPWLLTDFVRELRAMIRMFFDVRYHVAWSARITVLILLPLIYLSSYWMFWCLSPLSWIPLVGTALGSILEKTVDLVLAFLVYKALSREARRYLELKGTSP